MSTLRLFAVLAMPVVTLACSSSSGKQVATPTVATPPPVAVPPVTLNQRIQNIEIGQVFRGTLRGDAAFCVFVIDGSEEGLCDRFAVAASQSGMMTVRIVWDNVTHFLGITVPRAMSFPGIRCCPSPAQSRIPVTAGQTTEFYVYFAGATDGPGGHVPTSAEQSYELITSLDGT